MSKQWLAWDREKGILMAKKLSSEAEIVASLEQRIPDVEQRLAALEAALAKFTQAIAAAINIDLRNLS